MDSKDWKQYLEYLDYFVMNGILSAIRYSLEYIVRNTGKEINVLHDVDSEFIAVNKERAGCSHYVDSYIFSFLLLHYLFHLPV